MRNEILLRQGGGGGTSATTGYEARTAKELTYRGQLHRRSPCCGRYPCHRLRARPGKMTEMDQPRSYRSYSGGPHVGLKLHHDGTRALLGANGRGEEGEVPAPGDQVGLHALNGVREHGLAVGRNDRALQYERARGDEDGEELAAGRDTRVWPTSVPCKAIGVASRMRLTARRCRRASPRRGRRS